MSDTKEFSRKYRSQILNKLQETDKQITNNLQTFNINPIANLWSISQKIITNAKNESDEAASLLLANILLDNTKKMFTSTEISRILRKKITLT
jgi:aromatic ring-opening dioxygenase LigB subunit